MRATREKFSPEILLTSRKDIVDYCGRLKPHTDMKKLLLSSLAAATLAVGSNAYALIASDNASNYGSGWTNGSDGGTGFQPWSLSSGAGTGSAGWFIGDPSSGGIGGMSATSFGLYANTNGTGAYVNADRAFDSAMSVGDVLSFQWSINYDSGTDGNKGFNLYTGGVGGTQLINVNNAGSSAITLGGNDIGFAYGTNAMTWTFTLTDATTLAVTATARTNGGASFSTNVTVSAAPDSFRFYASQMQAGDQAQPYFNNLSVVPEPSTYALLAMSAAGMAGYVIRRRRR